ncbi:MAG TPA: energy transducer TonB [Allosphingosinicella sp.]|nr:energy transducer TonB [Allosphingosinicella sp.]
MRIDVANRRERVTAAIGVVALEALLGYALITGLQVVRGVPAPDVLRILNLSPPAPPPPKKPKPPPPKDRTKSPEGAASPPNLKATPTEIVRPPPPPILFPPPPPVAAAPIAGIGAAPSAGAAPVAGPGTGAGGQGNGTGSGAGGNGTGSGGGLGRGTAPRQIHGRIKDRDYPESARASGAQGTVWVRYTVMVDGRATNCRVLRSSGNGAIDETTCRLIQERFRYKPAKDAGGHPVQADVYEKHEFYMREGDAPPDDEDPGPD